MASGGWIASRSTAVRDEQGQPTRRIGVNWDITDMRNAQLAREEKLLAQRESQAKSQFLSRMSHELRTPLNAVLGFAQLLLADGERVSPETRRRRLEQIHGAGQHLLSLINDVLDLSSLEGGEHAHRQRSRCRWRRWWPRRCRWWNAWRGSARSSCAAALWRRWRWPMPRGLRQVLLNLLTNAVKYNREGGQVLVEAESPDGAVLLRVSDTGRGMNEAQLQQAFEPFNRLGLETRRHRRHRHRPGHRQGAGRAHGRHGAGAQRARAGQRVRGAAAGRHRRRPAPSRRPRCRARRR